MKKNSNISRKPKSKASNTISNSSIKNSLFNKQSTINSPTNKLKNSINYNRSNNAKSKTLKNMSLNENLKNTLNSMVAKSDKNKINIDKSVRGPSSKRNTKTENKKPIELKKSASIKKSKDNEIKNNNNRHDNEKKKTIKENPLPPIDEIVSIPKRSSKEKDTIKSSIFKNNETIHTIQINEDSKENEISKDDLSKSEKSKLDNKNNLNKKEEKINDNKIEDEKKVFNNNINIIRENDKKTTLRSIINENNNNEHNILKLSIHSDNKEESDNMSKNEKEKNVKDIQMDNNVNGDKIKQDENIQKNENQNDNIEEEKKDIKDSKDNQINTLKQNENLLSEGKNKNLLIENSTNITDKNKKLMSSLLNLLNKKYENKIPSKKDNKFLKLLDQLGESEKSKTIDILNKKGRRIFQAKPYYEIIKDNIKFESNNELSPVNSFRTKTNEERYQNLKNEYRILIRSNIKRYNVLYKNRFFNDYVEGKFPNLELLEKNKENNKDKENILFLSWNNLHNIKKKNNLNLLNYKNREYDSYNYKMILNSIDYKLNNLKFSKMKNLNKANSDFNAKTNNKNKNNYNTLDDNINSNEKKYSRYTRIQNIFENIKEGIKSIQNRKGGKNHLKKTISNDFYI